MHAAGYTYDERKKHFYVDNHEHPLIVKYRKEFTERYIKREVFMYRWVQVPLEVAERLEKDEEVPIGDGYRYTRIIRPTCTRAVNIGQDEWEEVPNTDELVLPLDAPYATCTILLVPHRGSIPQCACKPQENRVRRPGCSNRVP